MTMDTKDRLEPIKVCQIRQTHRVSLVAKYLPPTDHRGSRIVVSRADGGRDPMRTVINWSYDLGLSDNYAMAFNEYLARQNWGGSWTIGSTTAGYVAVCDDPEWGLNV